MLTQIPKSHQAGKQYRQRQCHRRNTDDKIPYQLHVDPKTQTFPKNLIEVFQHVDSQQDEIHDNKSQ